MCEPTLMIFDGQNNSGDHIGDHCRRPKSLPVPLIDPSCLNSNSPLSNFVNKCQALLNIKAQLKLEEKQARDKKISVENKCSLQLLPDYHSTEFAPEAIQTIGKNAKEKLKKKKFGRECNAGKQSNEKHVSPELQELIEPNNVPIGEPCPQPMSVKYRILDDPRGNQNVPIVVNETYPELAKYIRQLMDANTATNVMYGINFTAPDLRDVPMEARPNPYEILIPTVIEGLLNKLISSSSLSQKETEMFADFVYVSKSLEPHDLKTYFHLLKMRGVTLWDTIDKLRSRLMELRLHELSSMKIEDFLRDLKSAVLFGDPKEIKKEQERLKMEHASRLEDALKDTEEWIMNTSGYTKTKVTPKIIFDDTIESHKAGILKLSDPSKEYTQKSQSSPLSDQKNVPNAQTSPTAAEKKDTSEKKEDLRPKESVSKETLPKKGTYPEAAKKELDLKRKQEKKDQDFDDVKRVSDDGSKVSGKKEATSKQSKKDKADKKEKLETQEFSEKQRQTSKDSQPATPKDTISLQQSSKKDAQQKEKSEATIPSSPQETGPKVQKSAEPTTLEDEKTSPQLLEMQSKTQLKLGDTNRDAKAQHSDKKKTTSHSRDATPQPPTKQHPDMQQQQLTLTPQMPGSKMAIQSTDLTTEGEKSSSKKKEKDTSSRDLTLDKSPINQTKINVENLDDILQAKIDQEEKSIFPMDTDALSLKSLKPGDRDFRNKLASAFSAAQKYVDKTLFVQDSYAPEELLKNQKHSNYEPFVEVFKPPLLKTTSKIFNDSLQLLERYSYTNTGARKQGYFEPWDVEWPWPDLQDYITLMKQSYVKSMPDPNFSFRRGMEYYQAEFRRQN